MSDPRAQHSSFSTPHSTLLCGDNVTLLRAHIPNASIDLIYADPPFNSGHAYFATGKKHEGPRFHDAWRFDEAEFQAALAQCDGPLADTLHALRTILGQGDALAYCAALVPCLTQLKRVLKPTGSLYLHVDVKMSATVRLLLDALFGRENFRNEIVWAYRTGGTSKRHFSRKHDAILFYTVSDEHTFHPQYERVRYRKKFFSARQDAEGYYADVMLRDVWDIPAVINVSAQRTGYPTQKPIELLERIVRASSNEGDVVLDPFCGSGTALVAAQSLGRRWIGMDVSAEAIKIAAERLNHEEAK